MFGVPVLFIGEAWLLSTPVGDKIGTSLPTMEPTLWFRLELVDCDFYNILIISSPLTTINKIRNFLPQSLSRVWLTRATGMITASWTIVSLNYIIFSKAALQTVFNNESIIYSHVMFYYRKYADNVHLIMLIEIVNNNSKNNLYLH